VTPKDDTSNILLSVTINVGFRYEAPGVYFIEAHDTSLTNNETIATLNYQLGFSDSVANYARTTKVEIQNNSGTKIANTYELSLSSYWDKAYTNGQASVGVSETWTAPTGESQKRIQTVSPSIGGSANISHTISARIPHKVDSTTGNELDELSINYWQTDHTYHITVQALVDSTVVYSTIETSGTEAYRDDSIKASHQ
jgi:hypothetical protein